MTLVDKQIKAAISFIEMQHKDLIFVPIDSTWAEGTASGIVQHFSGHAEITSQYDTMGLSINLRTFRLNEVVGQLVMNMVPKKIRAPQVAQEDRN